MESVEANKVVRLSKSCISQSEKAAVMSVLDVESLGMGKNVEEFEKALSKFFGRSVVCVSTGTAALQLAVQAIGLGDGDEVLVQSLTYVASFQAISATGAIPVACDIDADTFCVDLDDAEKRITKNTKAIMPVHYCGGVGNLDEVYFFAKKHGLRVIEDAAHAFGTVYNERRVGGFGDIACFSFDGIKNITSGEGGCVVTNDEAVLDRIKDARLLGVEKDTEKRFSGERSWDFDVTAQGWRYHMSNIMAAIGKTQLSNFSQVKEKRSTLAKHYVKRLSSSDNIRLMSLDYDDVVPHIFVIELDHSLDRQNLRNDLLSEGVQSGIHYKPNHWLSFYKVENIIPLKITDKIFGKLLTLPLHMDLTLSDVDMVCDILLAKVK